MPVKCIADVRDTERQKCFIHIEDLPRLAYFQDIREFFYGLSIKEGGILIRHYDAFVTFDDPNDIDQAVSRKNHRLLGNEVQLSIISKAELSHILLRIARRKLDFSEENGNCRKPKSQNKITQRKKIRPTPVIRGTKRKTEPCSTFCPEESDFPPPMYNTDAIVLSWTIDSQFVPCKKKKIHPITVSDNTYNENFTIFHPQKCYEFAKMLLRV